MTMQSRPQQPVSVFHSQAKDPLSDQGKPEVPTMTSQSILEPLPLRPVGMPADELAEDIVAKPLTLPEFASDIQPYLANQGLAARWIFTDRRRYAEAKAQGWRNCTERDLKPGFATLSPFSEEGGTKFINGDLILMVMDRRRYLGALRDKHDRATRLSQNAAGRQISAQKARADLGPQMQALNRQRAMQGQPPLIEVFDPDDPDKKNFGAEGVADVGRIGGKRDTGRMADLNKEGN